MKITSDSISEEASARVKLFGLKLEITPQGVTIDCSDNFSCSFDPEKKGWIIEQNGEVVVRQHAEHYSDLGWDWNTRFISPEYVKNEKVAERMTQTISQKKE